MKKFSGVVSSAAPEASESGAEILREGGNAIDAAVAVSLALGVTEPAGSGLGGQASFIVQKQNNVPFAINGTSLSPAATPKDIHVSQLSGHCASTVPSIVKTLDFVWKHYGSGNIPWKRLVEPSVRYAKNGYTMGPFRRKALLRNENRIIINKMIMQLLLEPDGSVPKVGSVVYSPVLGETLQRLGDLGADDFYTGDIAKEIARDMKEHGGLITCEDLRQVKPPRVLPALCSKYKSWTVASLPPPASGWAVIMGLNILENAPDDIMKKESPQRLYWLLQAMEALRRQRVYKPVRDLVNYEDTVSKLISKEKARKITNSVMNPGSGETTHFSIVDKDGMAVGVTQSLNSYYGAMCASPNLGFMYNNYMTEFVSASRLNPFALRAGAMPYSYMSACILSRNSKPALVLGSPANDRIISAVIQVISAWVDMGIGIENAVKAPRCHVAGEEEVMFEKINDNMDTLLFLEHKGWTPYTPLSSLFAGDLNPYFGGVHAIANDNNRWVGAADPRRDGSVIYV